MIKHILKLLWNKRKNNAMMVLEIMLSFIVLFSVLTFVINNYIKYKSPLGFDTVDIYAAHITFDENLDSIQLTETKKLLKQELLANEYITDVAFSNGVIPFSGWTWQTGEDANGFEIDTKIAVADGDFFKTLGMKITEGRAFNDEDLNAKYKPLMISQNFRESYFPGKPVLDSVLIFGESEYIIRGIFEHYKYITEFEEEGNIMFYHLNGNDDTHNAVFRVKPGTPAKFEENVNKSISGILKNNDFVIENMEAKRKHKSAPMWMVIFALLTISLFLCVNVALGLFGVLWQNISKRRGEIGLRRALGAHTSSISLQITTEILIITFVGLLIGLFFAIQFPLLEVFDIEHSNYFYAMAISAGIILFLVLLCALYPSHLAAKIHPAIALHEE